MNITRFSILCLGSIIAVVQSASFGKISDESGYDAERPNTKTDTTYTDTKHDTAWSSTVNKGKPKPFSLPYFILPSNDRSRGLAALGFGGNVRRPYPYSVGKRTAGTPYYTLPSGQRSIGMASLGIGSSGYMIGKRPESDILQEQKRVSSFLPSYVIPSETSRNRGMAPLGIGSSMFRSGRNKLGKRAFEKLTNDEKVLADMADILSYLKREVDNATHEKLLQDLDEIVANYSVRK